MRILHMIPDIGVSNGVMSVILNYAKAMPDNIKFDVVYFSEQEKTKQKDIEKFGGRVYKIDFPSPKDLITGKMNAFFEQHKNEWQAVHIHCPHFAAFIAPNAKRAGIKNIIVHCHTTEFSLNGNSTRNKILSLYAKYFIKKKLACSKTAGDLWYGRKKYTVLNNAIDCERFRFNIEVRKKVREEYNISNSFVVSHIGKTSVKQKNHSFLFEVFAKIKEKNNSAKLLLIGGEKNKELSELSKKLNIENDVIYLGARSDLEKFLWASDVFLFPSLSEGLPVSVVEAQAAGLPVVMSDTITTEVVVTELVTVKSLKDSYKDWAATALGNSNDLRNDSCNLISKTKWNIVKNTEKLREIYGV